MDVKASCPTFVTKPSALSYYCTTLLNFTLLTCLILEVDMQRWR